jgi:hypothetical protein
MRKEEKRKKHPVSRILIFKFALDALNPLAYWSIQSNFDLQSVTPC